jgi:flagellar protein FliL
MMSADNDDIMIDGGEGEGAGGAKGKKKGLGKKMIIMLAGAVVLLGAGGYFGYTFFFQDHSKNPHEAKKEKKADEKMILLALEPFILNLSDPGRHLKVAIQFEIKDAKDEAAVKEKTPKLRDLVIMLISSKTVDAVSSAEGKFQLKDEILLRANQAMEKETFKNVYFTDFVMQ